MRLLGILRVSALFILVSAFHGPRGIFCSNLEVNPYAESPTVEVSEISENLKESTVESSSASSAPAPQSNLVFESSEWDDSKLASAFVFINEFCEDVISKKFKEQVTNKRLYGGIKAVCRDCMLRLKFLSHYFTPTYGPGSVDERNEISMDLYENALKPEQFEVYVRWLAENTFKIRDSLENMHHESLDMTEEQIKTDTSVGPLKYGFVYVYKGSWWSRPCYKNSLGAISRYCLAVMRSLAPMKHLLGCLDKNYGLCPQESSSKYSAPEPEYGLVFESSKWDDSMLANAVLFLEEFGRDVNAEKFKGKLSDANMKDLSEKCRKLSFKLESVTRSLIPRYGPGTVAEREEIPGNLYEDILEPKDFKVYAKWLKENIQNITESFKRMLKESLDMSEEQVHTETSRGPLKYGFVFEGKWWWWWKWFAYVNHTLRSDANALIQHLLPGILKCL
ncbi:secreted antigen 1 [Babesia divergens]|uniref:Secreted antigen 1 n=1 Tax=Babesia divergens TaxID=32595 RepID=A0AAD9GF50_BABDI|nr:secreted antigen 1 [Babesia divergens]